MKKIVLMSILLLMSACNMNSHINKNEITISAAASLKDAIEEIQRDFQEEYPDVLVNINFGSTGTLQQQIIQGAPVDVFISASKEKFEVLKERKLVINEHSTDILQNSLVLIGKKNIKLDTFQELFNLEFNTIAIGTPETVPAGKYAKETLESIGIWNQMEQKLIFGKDVRQVLSYVETGNVELGIVYLTDALLTDKVIILATPGKELYSPIHYSVGVVSNTKHIEEAVNFYNFLQKDKAIKIFEKYGFEGLRK